jgi:hypothetical protein
VQVFGYAILANLVVVVNHWSMSEDASKTRESVDISRESMYFLPPFLSSNRLLSTQSSQRHGLKPLGVIYLFNPRTI